MLGDILRFLDQPPTAENKKILHDFHKRVLGFDTISGKSEETVSRFLRLVEILWAEQGLFVRSSGRQPEGIENMELSETYHGKRIWDLL
jgi:trehalose-6-phosphatase